MARGVNKVILIGNLGNDPEVRYTPSGSAVANITLATTESLRDKQSGESQERTEWHRIVFFNRLAEIVGEYLRKGSKIYVEGSLRTRKWQDKNGIDRYTTETIANEMQMLDSRNANAQNASHQHQNTAAQNASSSSQTAASATAETTSATDAAPAMETLEDDIPF